MDARVKVAVGAVAVAAGVLASGRLIERNWVDSMKNTITKARRETLERQLGEGRDAIMKCTAPIVAAVAKRVDMALIVGSLKRDLGLPIVDEKTEANVIREFERQSAASGLTAEDGRDLAAAAIKIARRHQAMQRGERRPRSAQA